MILSRLPPAKYFPSALKCKSDAYSTLQKNDSSINRITNYEKLLYMQKLGDEQQDERV